MIAFIDDHRGELPVVAPLVRAPLATGRADLHAPLSLGPMARHGSLLPIAPSTCYDHLAKRIDPSRLSARARRDAELRPEIKRVFDASFRAYGGRKVWRQMRREGFDVARCTVARLMKEMGLEGIVRGKKIRTTIPDRAAPCPLDRVNRQFRVPAPNMLWVSDFTYVATWQGFVHVAFVIDAYARRIVGWRVSRTAHAGFVLDALDRDLGILRYATRNASAKQASSLRSAATTTRLPKPSTASSRPRSSSDAVPGAASRPWNMPPSNG